MQLTTLQRQLLHLTTVMSNFILLKSYNFDHNYNYNYYCNSSFVTLQYNYKVTLQI